MLVMLGKKVEEGEGMLVCFEEKGRQSPFVGTRDVDAITPNQAERQEGRAKREQRN